jgi:hypothetical protein
MRERDKCWAPNVNPTLLLMKKAREGISLTGHHRVYDRVSHASQMSRPMAAYQPSA